MSFQGDTIWRFNALFQPAKRPICRSLAESFPPSGSVAEGAAHRRRVRRVVVAIAVVSRAPSLPSFVPRTTRKRSGPG